MAPPCVAVAFSGGRDSTALLHATLRAAGSLGLRVAALHVHHGLLPQADDWVRLLQQRCARWARNGAPLWFHHARLQGGPSASESVEAWARRGRYAALARMAREADCSLVMLAHHRLDQAETVLLQLLRGAGAAGLSAMPKQVVREGIAWARPWLDMPREHIEAYVRRHRLRFIDDDSNADTRFARNRWRRQVWPALTAAFPDAAESLALAARRAQEEAACLCDLAQQDLTHIAVGETLAIAAWAALPPHRRANAFRAWYRQTTGRGAAETLLQRLLRELPERAAPARWAGPGGELRRYRGVLRWHADARDASRPEGDTADRCSRIAITRPGRYELAGWNGALHAERVEQGGVALAWLADVALQERVGAERFLRHPKGVPRSLKKQYQAAGVAAWERNGPLLYSEGRLVFVPALGIDARALAAPGVPQVALRWQPRNPTGALHPGNP